MRSRSAISLRNLGVLTKPDLAVQPLQPPVTLLDLHKAAGRGQNAAELLGQGVVPEACAGTCSAWTAMDVVTTATMLAAAAGPGG